ncbi:MAG: hypothetical protein K8T26_01145 [Lentisphaerae bacterium]|nr:hypothetical protein [Lentisphaerota bacterium]
MLDSSVVDLQLVCAIYMDMGSEDVDGLCGTRVQLVVLVLQQVAVLDSLGDSCRRNRHRVANRHDCVHSRLRGVYHLVPSLHHNLLDGMFWEAELYQQLRQKLRKHHRNHRSIRDDIGQCRPPRFENNISCQVRE